MAALCKRNDEQSQKEQGFTLSVPEHLVPLHEHDV